MRIKLKSSITAPLLALIMYILMAISSMVDIEKLGQRDNVFLAVIILQIVIFIIPGILYCKLRGKEFTPRVRVNGFGPQKLWFSVSAFFVLAFGSALVKLGLYAIGYYSQQYTLYENYLPKDASSLANVLYIIIAIAIIPAITEEFIFRGIILGEYSAMGTSHAVAVMLSSALFAMLHFNFYHFPVYFYGGIVLGYTVLICDSAICAMIVHLLNNTFSLLFEPQLLRLISQTDSLVFVLFVLTIVFLVFLILMLQSAERIYYTKGINGEASPPVRKRRKKKDGSLTVNKEALLSPAFFLCIIAYIVIIFTLK